MTIPSISNDKSSTELPRALAVYCASSIGNNKAYQLAARSIGHALARTSRPLVYGGGSKGLMGVVSGAVLEGGGDVTGVVPWAMAKAGGEKDKSAGASAGKERFRHIELGEKGREKVNTIIVDSMHDRKVEMGRRAGGFIGLPGGFGTFEEILEVTTWTQLGIHNKPVLLINVLDFYAPLRALVRSSISSGFIDPSNERLFLFVNGPAPPSQTLGSDSDSARDEWIKAHEEFDWGSAALRVLEGWGGGQGVVRYPFDWSRTRSKEGNGETVSADGTLAGA